MDSKDSIIVDQNYCNTVGLICIVCNDHDISCPKLATVHLTCIRSCDHWWMIKYLVALLVKAMVAMLGLEIIVISSVVVKAAEIMMRDHL